jgi:hypothetical protein
VVSSAEALTLFMCFAVNSRQSFGNSSSYTHNAWLDECQPTDTIYFSRESRRDWFRGFTVGYRGGEKCLAKEERQIGGNVDSGNNILET